MNSWLICGKTERIDDLSRWIGGLRIFWQIAIRRARYGISRIVWTGLDVDRSPLDILAPVLMYCALLWWIGRRMSWVQLLAVTAITLAVIILVLLFERG